MGPSTIIEIFQRLDLSKKRLEFGAYILDFFGTSNNMKERGAPEIALKASNGVGGFYFMSLYTGKKIYSYIWNEVPITDSTIKRIH